MSKAELLKLAHTLDVSPADLGMLASLADEDLRTLRRQVGEALFRADKAAFSRVAALSKAVPAAVAARLTELALPPLLAARTAELLEPARAVDMVNRISDGYLADVSSAMDASRAPQVIAAIPAERVARVGGVLAQRRAWVVMGGFVSAVSGDALAATVAELDGEQLLRVGFVLEEPARADEINALLTDAQVDDLLAAAAAVPLWAEFATLTASLTGERADRLAERFALASDEVRDMYRAAVQAGDLDTGTFSRLDAPAR